jgi:hypothetical protein
LPIKQQWLMTACLLNTHALLGLADGSPLACCTSGNSMTLYMVTSMTASVVPDSDQYFEILTYPDKTVVYNMTWEGEPTYQCSVHLVSALMMLARPSAVPVLIHIFDTCQAKLHALKCGIRYCANGMQDGPCVSLAAAPLPKRSTLTGVCAKCSDGPVVANV